MQLQLQSFAALVGAAGAAVQGSARQLVDLTVGSTLRALLEASASVALWIQWLIVQVLETTRAATSSDEDLDSWMADFSVTRLPAVAAKGEVTFGRFAASGSALVPSGTIVRTADGTQSFAVVPDTGRAAYSAGLGGYLMADGIAALAVPVQAIQAGQGGNVQPEAVTLIVAALAGVDTVTNAAAFSGGLDAEGDAALRRRFTGFMASLARATPAAVGYSIESVQQGLQYTLQENALPDGTPRLGSFVVAVDDGTGAPSATLLSAVRVAVEAMRPVGASFTVQAPARRMVDVSMSVAVAPGSDAGAVKGGVEAAVRQYIDGLPLGAPLAWSRLVQVAYGASAAVVNVGPVLLNGASADIAVTPIGVVRASQVAVN